MTQKSDGRERKVEEVYHQKKRKLYIKPKLIEYGRIETLTHGTTGNSYEVSGAHLKY